jgi:hypothetical protein
MNGHAPNKTKPRLWVFAHCGINRLCFKVVLRKTLRIFQTLRIDGESIPFFRHKAVPLAIFLGLWVMSPWFGCANATVKADTLVSVEGLGDPVGNVIDGFQGQSLRDTAWWGVAEQRGLDPYILYAVALVESAKVTKRVAKPWPWALNRQGRPFIPASVAEAKAILGGSLAKGVRSIDVGLMQVNVRWQGHRVRQPEDLLDPATNLRVGADILAESIGSAPGNLVLGIGRYHAGFQDEARAYRYGRRVLSVARQIRRLI